MGASVAKSALEPGIHSKAALKSITLSAGSMLCSSPRTFIKKIYLSLNIIFLQLIKYFSCASINRPSLNEWILTFLDLWMNFRRVS
jgi:hypothetical protein